MNKNPTLRTASKSLRIVSPLLASVLLTICLVFDIKAQGSTDGTTPLGLSPGSPTGSYALSDFDVVNLYNGSLNFRLPVYQIAGRGGAAYRITLQVQKKWTVYRHFEPGIGYFYYADGSWWNENGVGWILDAGRVDIRTGYREQPTGFPVEGLTRVTFTAPDGTEYEFRDQSTNGQPKALVSGGFNRGKVFVTADGTTATFISDWDIHETAYGLEPPAPDGYIKLKDGTQFRVDDGTITWMRDRNGNKVTFGYDPFRRLTSITDSLNRLVTISYPGGTTGFTQISFKGYGGASRTIKIGQTNLANALRSGYTMLTGSQMFPEMHGVWGIDSSVINYVELPDGRSYQLRYNPYSELARVVLPTGGAIEYDYAAGLTDGAASGVFSHNFPPTEKYIYRRVVERRIYPDGGSGAAYESKMTYSRPETTTTNLGYVITEQRNVSGTLLTKSQHYFHGSPRASFLLRPTHYPAWKDSREYKTEVFHTNGTTILRRVENSFAQRASVSWWGGSADTAPPNDPRTTETITTIEPGGANLVSKQTFGYDDTVPFNNQNNLKEYNFGTGSAGSLARETRTTFVTSSGYTDNTVHLRGLPAQVSIHDAGGTERARATYEYDNYTTDTNHAALTNRSNISGLDSAFGTSYTTRGNATATTNYFLVSGSVTGSISTYSQYDIAGNVVKGIDGRGFVIEYLYPDCFGTPNGEAQTSTDPIELGSVTKTFAYVTQVKNALNQWIYAQFDYHLGRVVDARDVNGIVASGYYDDQLDRPTQVKRAIGTAAESHTAFAYDDANRTITTTSDLTINNDGLLVSKLLYDLMGRTIETRQYESGSNYIATLTEYDALGRAFKISNPFRPWQSESAVWTTTGFDALGRVISVTTPDNAIAATSYSGNSVTASDQTGKQRKSVTDALGRLVQVYEAPNDVGFNYQTSYVYDLLDNLTTVTQGSQTRTFVYDSLKRLTSSTNPESGTAGYQYDNNGNLLVKTDARGVSAHYEYDALNRPTRRWYNGSSSVSATTNNNPVLPSGVGTSSEAKYFYDAQTLPSGAPSYARGSSIGRLVAEVYGTGSNGNYFAYDVLGRRTLKIQQTGSINYPMSGAYNLVGALRSMTYPSGHSITNSYDDAGRLSSFAGTLGEGTQRTYSASINYSPFGGMGQEQLGTDTAIFNKRFYNSRGQLAEIRAGLTGNDTSWQRGAIINHYSDTCWGMCSGQSMTDNNGNVKKQEHWIQDGNGNVTGIFTQQYEYDQLNRLKRVYEGSNWQQQYAYDRWGNRTVDQNATWGVGIPKPNFGVNTTTNRLTAPAGYTMGYDQAGNLTNDTYTGEGQRSYDAENRMTQAWSSNHWQTYSYDGSGQRVRRVINGSETWQVYGLGGELIAEYAANVAPANPQKEYGYRNGELLITASTGSACGVGYQGAKSWTATHPSLGHATGQQEGGNWAVYVGTHAPHAMVYGPYDNTFGQGQHTAQFNLRVDNNSGSDVVATLDVVTGSGANVLAVRQIRRNEFTAANQWQTFTVSFNNPCFGLVEGRVWWAGNTNTKFSQMTIASVTTAATDIRWLVTDHLGTPRLVLNQTGSLATVSRHDYLPFGEELYAPAGGRSAALGYVSSDGVRQQFTSYERDTESGLDFAGARFYASSQGRFTSVDPLMASAITSNPQTFNRYSYVTNSPINMIDPTGMFGICPGGGQIGQGGVPLGSFSLNEGTTDESEQRRRQQQPPQPKQQEQPKLTATVTVAPVEFELNLPLNTQNPEQGPFFTGFGSILTVTVYEDGKPVAGATGTEKVTGSKGERIVQNPNPVTTTADGQTFDLVGRGPKTATRVDRATAIAVWDENALKPVDVTTEQQITLKLPSGGSAQITFERTITNLDKEGKIKPAGPRRTGPVTNYTVTTTKPVVTRLR